MDLNILLQRGGGHWACCVNSTGLWSGSDVSDKLFFFLYPVKILLCPCHCLKLFYAMTQYECRKPYNYLFLLFESSGPRQKRALLCHKAVETLIINDSSCVKRMSGCRGKFAESKCNNLCQEAMLR